MNIYLFKISKYCIILFVGCSIAKDRNLINIKLKVVNSFEIYKRA